MKTRLIVVLVGLCSLFASSVVLAHNHGHRGGYAGAPVTGGITIWGDSYGRTAYAGSINLGYVGGYAATPYYGPRYGASCSHMSPYGYSGSYRPGYRHGYRDGRHDRRYNRHYNGGYYGGGRH